MIVYLTIAVLFIPLISILEYSSWARGNSVTIGSIGFVLLFSFIWPVTMIIFLLILIFSGDKVILKGKKKGNKEEKNDK